MNSSALLKCNVLIEPILFPKNSFICRSIVGNKQLEDDSVQVCNDAIKELLEGSGPKQLITTISRMMFALIYYFCYGKQ